MPDVLAARLLVSYHLGHQRPMMAAFLDALGIVHDNGLISDELSGAVADDKLKLGAEALASAYPADDVRLYFETLLLQDPDTWAGLASLARRVGRLAALGGGGLRGSLARRGRGSLTARRGATPRGGRRD